jgi:hypothetical protein
MDCGGSPRHSELPPLDCLFLAPEHARFQLILHFRALELLAQSAQRQRRVD